MKRTWILSAALVLFAGFGHAEELALNFDLPGNQIEFPVLRAQLHPAPGAEVSFPRPISLTVNALSDSSRVSFDLLVDTGIRCVKAPCPSTKTIHFLITDTQDLSDNGILYTAVEDIELDPQVIGPMKQLLEVTAYDRATEGPSELWNVILSHFGRRRLFTGIAQAIFYPRFPGIFE